MNRQLVVVQGCVLRTERLPAERLPTGDNVLADTPDSRTMVLLVRRHEPSSPEIHGKLELPGGKVHIGETLDEAIQREIQEETGVRARAGYMLPFPYVAQRVKARRRFGLISICYRCYPVQWALSRSGGRKISEAKWQPIESIDPLEVQSGSLAFISEVLSREGFSRHLNAPSRASWLVLKSVEATSNRHRHYGVKVESQLLDGSPKFQVTRFWGRRFPTRAKENIFSDRDKLLRFLDDLLRTRRSHGYVITDVSDPLHFLNLKAFREMERDPAPDGQLPLFPVNIA